MYTMKNINQQGHGRLKNFNYLPARPVKLRKSRVSQEGNSSEKQELSLFLIYFTLPFFPLIYSLEKVRIFCFNFQDLGNVNLSFFTPRKLYNRKENLALIVQVLQERWKLRVKASCRDDILIDEKFKISFYICNNCEDIFLVWMKKFNSISAQGSLAQTGA